MCWNSSCNKRLSEDPSTASLPSPRQVVHQVWRWGASTRNASHSVAVPQCRIRMPERRLVVLVALPAAAATGRGTPTFHRCLAGLYWWKAPVLQRLKEGTGACKVRSVAGWHSQVEVSSAGPCRSTSCKAQSSSVIVAEAGVEVKAGEGSSTLIIYTTVKPGCLAPA